MNKVIIIWGVILIVFFESCVLPLNQEWVESRGQVFDSYNKR